MSPTELTQEMERLRYMMQRHLQYRALTSPPLAAGRHLDEDTLAVFVEGRLSEREGLPLVTHLVNCASCRHSTTQLIRLATEIETEPPLNVAEPLPEPSVFRRFFNNLSDKFSNSAGFDSESVFAYHETEESETNDNHKSNGNDTLH